MICICFHIYDLNIFLEFLEYYRKINNFFINDNILLINFVNKKESIELYKQYKNEFNYHYVTFLENKGTDIYPFMFQINFLKKLNLDISFIFKIHSKNDDSWRKNIIDPLISFETLNFIKKKKNNNNNNNNIGFISSLNNILNKNYDKDFIQNIIGVNYLNYKFNYINNNYKFFVAGTMFWIHFNVFKNLDYKFINFFEEKYCLEKPPSNLYNKKIFFEYVLERVFTGSLCFDKDNYGIYKNNIIKLNNTNFLGNLKHIKY